jgi:hypothetical protein
MSKLWTSGPILGAKGYAPANAEAQCRRGGGAGGPLNKKFPNPTFSGYLMAQMNSLRPSEPDLMSKSLIFTQTM